MSPCPMSKCNSLGMDEIGHGVASRYKSASSTVTASSACTKRTHVPQTYDDLISPYFQGILRK
eukprot:scaffold59704_cov35-Cyclotella_meneghiniana.AAC.7